jgi:hypothetical protein
MHTLCNSHLINWNRPNLLRNLVRTTSTKNTDNANTYCFLYACYMFFPYISSKAD